MSGDESLATPVEIVIVEPDPLDHRLLYVRHVALAVGDHRWAWLSSKTAMDSGEREGSFGRSLTAINIHYLWFATKYLEECDRFSTHCRCSARDCA